MKTRCPTPRSVNCRPASSGQQATRYGMRRSPVFVGEVDGSTEIVRYIAPHWDDAPTCCRACAIAPGARSAPRLCCGSGCRSVSSTSTPLPDANGRVSRFLINDVLRRDGASLHRSILPISATITSSVIDRRSYDQVLDVLSPAHAPVCRRLGAGSRADCRAWRALQPSLRSSGTPCPPGVIPT